ncbi:hypothetical protein SRHO_G00107970 [Serrasalmus rhombeus]
MGRGMAITMHEPVSAYTQPEKPDNKACETNAGDRRGSTVLVTAGHGARGSAGALLAHLCANIAVTGMNGTGRRMPQSHPLSQITAHAKPSELLTDMPKTRELALLLQCPH